MNNKQMRPALDFTAKKITVTKKYMMEASTFNTPEFHELREMRQRFPGFTVEVKEIKKAENKQTYANLTYEHMEAFIKGKEDAQTAIIRLKELHFTIEYAKRTQKAAYVYVKKWFLNQYAEDFKTKMAKALETEEQRIADFIREKEILRLEDHLLKTQQALEASLPNNDDTDTKKSA